MRTIVTMIGIVTIAGIGWLQAARQEPSSPSPSSASSHRALLNTYCVTCHNQKVKTAGVTLDNVDVEHVSADAELWEKVVRKLRTGTMPPAGAPRPDQAGYDSLATYLEKAFDSAAAAKPNPGRSVAHRLNRAEYTNAIRDLLALDIDGESLLPADDSSHGFDNIGDVLSVSPSLLERYISVARSVSRLAIVDPALRPPDTKYDISVTRLQDGRASEELPFGSRGGIAVRHNFPFDGEYLIKIRLLKTHGNTGGYYFGLGELGESHPLDVRLDGARIKLFTLDSKSGSQVLKPEDVEAGLEVRFQATAGSHVVGVAFLDEGTVSEEMVRPPYAELHLQGLGPKSNSTLDPGVDSVTISGPHGAKNPGDTASRRKIFVCSPTAANDEDACARKILSTLARGAYRRPPTEAEVQGLLGLYKAGRNEGFEAGIRRALQGILVSRDFLFRIERDPVPASVGLAADTPYRVSDLELASRLSFFLWSSLPDDQLLDLAEGGKLRDSGVLEQQVRRMLADRRSKALVDNFFGQWLALRSVRTARPDNEEFPAFDENLREAFQREMDLFLESMFREDRSVAELLSADYTFVNDRLARHYDIPNIYGSRFRRVTLSDENRWGLLGKGSILTLTSQPNRTAPVGRGKWVLENILGTPPPPPPPNVPGLDETKTTVKPLSMRARIEQHRANPACASCHARMDPIGFALEHFDAIGRWRATEIKEIWNETDVTVTESSIDDSGAFPDGAKFQGPIELRKLLLSKPEQFVTTVTEKLLTYALGRGVEYYDWPAIRKIVREAAGKRGDPPDSSYRWSSVILGIVESAPFQMRKAAGPTTAAGLR